ncbi:hypothetical protein BJ944DRAFT_261377 [Cunninghamella echinulata]|nr:hypothetical protein BJ944DRAFT_261377 [Cunninghamella echinulata]
MNHDTTFNYSSNSSDDKPVNNQHSTERQDERSLKYQMSDNKDVQAAFDQLTRKDSLKNTDASSSASFTQRLIDRGVIVPSFPNWEDSKSTTQQELSSSSGSLANEFDSSAYYGLSPFVTSSFSGTGSHSYGTNNSNSDTSSKTPLNDSKYFSLRHRYERENKSSSHPYHLHHLQQKYKTRNHHREDGDNLYEEEEEEEDEEKEKKEEEDEDEADDEDDGDNKENDITTKKHFNSNKKRVGHSQYNQLYQHSHTGDSDIELSDEDLEKPSTNITFSNSKTSSSSHQLPLKKSTGNNLKQTIQPSLAKEFTSSDLIDDKESIPPPSSLDKLRKVMSMKGYKGFEQSNPIDNQNDEHPNKSNTTILQQLNHTHTKIYNEADAPYHMLSTSPQKSKRLTHKTPRSHLLQTAVYDLINGNANNVRDRYLFLFSDLLLICDPIMDENIIVGSNTLNNNVQDENRYRFRPNEGSLFQVKNIVELNKLTLYLTQEDIQQQQQQLNPPSSSSSLQSNFSSTPSAIPPRKIHPTMATALRKFESDAESGINFLIEKQLLTSDPLSIASFLFKIGDLNRSQLGKYLGDKKNSDVYDAFLDYFRLVGLRLDEALRILLTTFRLPSQWESLEYLIERFAKKWHDANQNVVKFHEDMVVKVVVSMLFLNSETWYDADSDRDVFWYARKRKEQRDRQRLTRRATAIDERKSVNRGLSPGTPGTASISSIESPTVGLRSKQLFNLQSHQSLRSHYQHRDSVAVEPLHYITALREKTGQSHKPTLKEYLERWSYFDQYTLVPHEFMEDMYKSISTERLETGWDNKTGPVKDDCNNNDGNNGDGMEDRRELINVIPHRLPTRIIKGVPSVPITLSITQPDPGLQIKLRGQDLVMEPSLLDFSTSSTQSFTITGNTLGRTSLMFIKYGNNAGNYVSPGLTRTKPIVVEAPLMRFTFQIEFSHADINAVKEAAIKAATDKTNSTTTLSSPSTTNNDNHNDNNILASNNNTIKKIKKESKHNDILRRGSVATLAALTSTPSNHEEYDEIESSSSPSPSMVESDGNNIISKKSTMVKRKYTFSVETEQEKMAWITHLSQLCGCVIITGGDLSLSSSASSSSSVSTHNKNAKNIYRKKITTLPSPEERVALQVLKELLLADEIKKGTASVAMRTSTPAATKNLNENELDKDNNNNSKNNSNLLMKKASAMNLKSSSTSPSSPEEINNTGLLNALASINSKNSIIDANENNIDDPNKSLKQKLNDDATGENHNSLVSLSGGATNVVTKRGHEIIKLVVQNSMVPFMLGFLRSQID